MYLITLYFDETTDKELNKWIGQVAKVTGNSFMQENQVPPHMTLGAFEAQDEKTAKQLFQEMSFSKAGEVQLVSVGSFMSRVLYVSVVYSEFLHELALEVDRVLAQSPSVKIRQSYRPFSWFPHVTIGKQMAKEQLSVGFAEMQNYFHVMTGNVVRIGLSRTNPYRDLGIIELS